MCKIVYLTFRRFDIPSKVFTDALATELRKRKIEVIVKPSNDFLNKFFRKHRTYGIALAFDFYKDDKKGCGLTLNKNCSRISKDFAYNLSSGLDILTPEISWRDFKFVDSNDKNWFEFFNKVSSITKGIFYLCTINNKDDLEAYLTSFDKIVKTFSDEIIRCLRSDYDTEEYRKRVRLSKIRFKK